MMLDKNTKTMIRFTDGNTNFFEIVFGVFHSDI